MNKFYTLRAALSLLLSVCTVYAPRGSTVDLTLFDTVAGKEVDMDGTFDWFGKESHPDRCGDPETGKYTGDFPRNPARWRQDQ